MSDPTNRERRARINQMRFTWHEQVLSDGWLRRHPNALALAGYIMHRFHVEKNYAEFSNKGASKALNMPARSVNRAKQILLERGWIVLQQAYEVGKPGWSANHYALSGGAEDLVIDEHQSADAADTGIDDKEGEMT